MNTRKIKYIDLREDTLQQGVEWAVKFTMENRLAEYCKHIIRNYAMAGIDVMSLPVQRHIYYIEDEK